MVNIFASIETETDALSAAKRFFYMEIALTEPYRKRKYIGAGAADFF